MRTFLSAHWKSILILVILVLLAFFTMTPGAASPALATRLRAHVLAMATNDLDTAARPAGLEQAARHIESALSAYGYQVRGQQYMAGGQRVRNIEASVANVAAGVRPERIFIVGAHVDPAPGSPAASDNGSGAAAVLEMARLLRQLQPARGTEIKFVFFVHEAPPWFVGDQDGTRHAQAPRREGHKLAAARIRETGGRPAPARDSTQSPALAGPYPDSGSFIAFAGTRASSAPVRQALAAFRGGPEVPAEGLAAPAYVEGVTLLDQSTYTRRLGYPALIITDTAFLRYPYYHTADNDEKRDYEGMARVVKGLARTIGALAGGTRT